MAKRRPGGSADGATLSAGALPRGLKTRLMIWIGFAPVPACLGARSRLAIGLDVPSLQMFPLSVRGPPKANVKSLMVEAMPCRLNVYWPSSSMPTIEAKIPAPRGVARVSKLVAFF